MQKIGQKQTKNFKIAFLVPNNKQNALDNKLL